MRDGPHGKYTCLTGAWWTMAWRRARAWLGTEEGAARVSETTRWRFRKYPGRDRSLSFAALCWSGPRPLSVVRGCVLGVAGMSGTRNDNRRRERDRVDPASPRQP